MAEVKDKEPYQIEVQPHLDKILLRLGKKAPRQYQIIKKKTEEIVKNPHRYKNLHAPLNEWRRVHIDKHFVLTFSIDEETKTVILEDYDHHDRIYKRQA